MESQETVRKKHKSKKTLTQREEKRLQWWKKKQEKKEEDKEGNDETTKSTQNDSLKKETNKDLTQAQLGSDAEHVQEDVSEENCDHDTSDVETKTPKEDKTKKKFYVLFLGNLPYSASEEDIAKHFQQIGGIKAVRLLTDPKTKKSKGCAYIEFTNSRFHKLALMLHHSTLKGRKINVEFTSAGRKSERRTEKLKQKNKVAERFKVGPHFRVKIEKKVQERTDTHFKKGRRK